MIIRSFEVYVTVYLRCPV